MVVQMKAFTGLIPKLSAMALPDNAAQYALDCNFNYGAIVGLRGHNTYTSYTAGSAIKSGFAYTSTTGYRVYTWTYDTDAVKGPALNDKWKRYYWTGNNGGTTEFKFALATESEPYVGSAGTSYKVGVINSTPWISGGQKPLSFLGVSFEVRNRTAPIAASAITDATMAIFLCDETGTKVQDLPSQSFTAVGSPVNGWYSSYTTTLPKVIDDYAKDSSVGYTKVTKFAQLSLGESTTIYQADVWYAAGTTTVKFILLTAPIPATYPSGYSSGSATPVTVAIGSMVQIGWDGGAEQFQTETSVTMYFRSPSTLSYSNTVDPPSSVTSATASMPSKLYLGAHWSFKYNGQSYDGYIYENKSLSSTFDIGGGITGSLQRNTSDNKTFTLVPEFGSDLPLETRSYVVTLVNRLSEESEPSSPFELSLNPGKAQVCAVINTTTFAAAVINATMTSGYYPLHGARFYRTATDSSGNTEFLYAFTVKITGETDILGENYISPSVVGSNWEVVDNVAATGLGSACPTQNYISNAADLQNLQGLTALHNGMMGAFNGNDVWVSEPFKPWGWTPKGIITLPKKVVRLVPIEQGFVALTEGRPYLCMGNTPDTIVAQPVQTELPCIHKRAACLVGGIVMYLSPEGPVRINGLNAEPDASFSREQWRDAYSAYAQSSYSMGLTDWGHRVIAYYQGASYAGGVLPGWIFDVEDNAWSSISTRIDYAMPVPAGTFGYKHDSLAFVDGGTQWKLFAENGTNGAWVWQSKDFSLPKPTNFGVVQLRGSGTGVLKVYANGNLVFTSSSLTLTKEGVKVRLPSGFRETVWSFRFEGTSGSSLLEMNAALSVEELRGV